MIEHLHWQTVTSSSSPAIYGPDWHRGSLKFTMEIQRGRVEKLYM